MIANPSRRSRLDYSPDVPDLPAAPEPAPDAFYCARCLRPTPCVWEDQCLPCAAESSPEAFWDSVDESHRFSGDLYQRVRALGLKAPCRHRRQRHVEAYTQIVVLPDPYWGRGQSPERLAVLDDAWVECADCGMRLPVAPAVDSPTQEQHPDAPAVDDACACGLHRLLHWHHVPLTFPFGFICHRADGTSIV
jgi:hypothetical protein